MKALIAEFKQESNSFNRQKEFISYGLKRMSFRREAEVMLISTHNDMNAYYGVLKKEGIDDITVSACVNYMSGGIFPSDLYNMIADTVAEDIMKVRPDIVLLAMSGTIISQKNEDATGAFIRRCREVMRDCVIGVTLDMHANVTPEIIKNVDIVCGYKTSPHMDIYESGMKTAQLALQIAKKEIKPAISMVKLPMIIPVEMGCTEIPPMHDVMKKARGIENRQGVYLCNVSVVQPWMNVKGVGCAVSVCADDQEKADGYALEMAEYIWNMRENTRLKMVDIKNAIEIARRTKELPVLFIDSADSPGAGASGDSAAVIKGLLEYGDGLKAITNVVDPAAARLAVAVGEGKEVTVKLGYSADPSYGTSVEFTGIVKRICSEYFSFKGPVMTGRALKRGLTVLLEKSGLCVLVMENAVDNRDPELYRSAGLSIENSDIVQVKSASGYILPYEGLYSERVVLDTPGASSARFSRQKYNNTGWSIYPIDKTIEFKPFITTRRCSG